MDEGEVGLTEDVLGTEFVRLALRAAERQPILKAVYLGPAEWLQEAARDPGEVIELAQEAARLGARAEAADDHYVAAECRSIAAQLDVLAGRSVPYSELVGELYGCELVPPDGKEVSALRDEVQELAANLMGGSSTDAVRKWERANLLTGEPKWDAALDAYQLGRRFVFEGDFPIAIKEDLNLVRIEDELWSVALTWYPPRRMAFEVNVATARTGETTAFEVAHNIYPGDYLHLAVLSQHTYQRLGKVAACIKLKNAPENVIAEGIEETAYLRLHPDPSPEHLLAAKLEWLRRAATVVGALSLRVDGAPEDQVVASMVTTGFMDEGRARFQLRLIQHPLWGTYQYTYWIGRKLVEEGDRRAVSAGRQREFLVYLYAGLHTPASFLSGLDQLLAAPVVPGLSR